MTWSYTLPIATDMDAVRFHVGDTDTDNQLVQDEEIDYALTLQSDVLLASAIVLRAMVSKYGSDSNVNIGSVSVGSVNPDTWRNLIKQFDPMGVTSGSVMVLPYFGGISVTDKEALEDDTDIVQPWFYRNKDNIPGGPDDSEDWPYDE